MKHEKTNPIGRIWQIAEKEHGRLLLSVVYAIFGVIAGVVPFFAAARMVTAFIEGNRNLNYYLVLVLIAFSGYVLKSVLYSAGLSVSHRAAFSLLAEIRKEF